ncbi:SRPBCC family protein [Bacillus gobiensis]|uniref:SRPBCC family protein n=1 Tax=Bacillus gobiensis TaxID=1441095 RepID=UPI003D1DB747
MPIIEQKIWINAPIEICFDSARNVGTHTKTLQTTKEEAVAGVTNGLMEEGDTVTWEAVHFGIRQRLTAKITRMEKPHYFTDMMIKGAFSSFTHHHLFNQHAGGTMITDIFEYKSPFGLLGVLADKLFLEKYMRRLLFDRAISLKKIAENDDEK